MSVMIRLEHTLLLTHRYSVKKCQQLVQSCAKVLGKSDRMPILTADIGSQSWSWSVKNKMELVIAEKQTKASS